MMLRLGRIERVVYGALHHPHVDLERRRCSACRSGEHDERAHRDPVPLRDLVRPYGARLRARTR